MTIASITRLTIYGSSQKQRHYDYIILRQGNEGGETHPLAFWALIAIFQKIQEP